ncbi:MAG: hypothetical protein O3C17_25425 [Planctomycetota bacterium]|nr:hypothetical protein [Planctomycetota bacterium]
MPEQHATMTTFAQTELRSRIIQQVELTIAAELAKPSQTRRNNRPPRIDSVLYDALEASGTSPRHANLETCKDLVVRAARFAKRIAEPGALAAK